MCVSSAGEKGFESIWGALDVWDSFHNQVWLPCDWNGKSFRQKGWEYLHRPADSEKATDGNSVKDCDGFQWLV